jgi:DNA-binding Lrp family transcriptional regulator
MFHVKKPEMDEIDFKIARLLRENARLSYKEIGEKVSLSASSVYERARRMDERGVIKKYETHIDWDKFGYSIHAFILLKDDKVIGKVPDFLKEKEEVYNCWMISGDYDYMVEIYVENNQKFEELINYFYEKMGRTRSFLIIKDIFTPSVPVK